MLGKRINQAETIADFQLLSIKSESNKNNYSLLDEFDFTKKEIFIDFKKARVFQWIDFSKSLTV